MRNCIAFTFVVAASMTGCGGGNKVAEAPATTTETGTTATASASGEQSYADAMKLVCDSPEQCGCMDQAADQKATQLAEWIMQRLSNEEAKSFFGEVSAFAPEERKPRFAESLARAGIDPASCSFYTNILR